jgi:hypothetical protein
VRAHAGGDHAVLLRSPTPLSLTLPQIYDPEKNARKNHRNKNE